MNTQTLYEKLKFLRLTRGYTQQWVADRIHISRQTYQHYECGRSTPDTLILYLLSELYAIPLVHLLSNETPITQDDLLKEAPAYGTGNLDIIATLIYKFRRMTPEQQRRVLQYIITILKED